MEYPPDVVCALCTKRAYPYCIATLMNPLRFLRIKLKLSGLHSKDSLAPPGTRTNTFPVPSLVKCHFMLALLHEHDPVVIKYSRKKGKLN